MYAIPLDDNGGELVPLEPWHAEEFLASIDRGRDVIGRFIPLPGKITDLESARAYLRSYMDKTATDTGRLYGIRVHGKLVGSVMIRLMDVEQGTAEIGCWLEPTATGRGLVTRAVRHVIDWAVEERGLHRVEWRASTANEPSIAVARRLGMTKEGVLRELFLHEGERHDIEVWSVLAPEWRAAKAAASA
ncbi:GNAT family N-acetyltransferase [Streptomyces huiliensis]|uniref:GNAT family N-acetyltransferase n=1 Tax=Streptomyces huiliensis TaxID=2876027 RepID=UPI001CBD1892|nr:GNAT family protein [Streptomyces huiliensis]MBZ4319272.1 GNAT family N-acetyltransferase [Streptomyces huiliensis]